MSEIWNVISDASSWIMSHIVIINILLAILIVFFERRDPNTVWAWLLLLYFIPIVGFIFWLFIGQDMHRSKLFRMKELEDKMHPIISKQEETIFKDKLQMEEDSLKGYTDLVLYNLESSGAVYTDDNEVSIYTDGKEKFAALIEELKKAKKFIHMQYYIIRSDELFSSIKEVLMEKVKEGVTVRVLYDGMGSKGLRKSDIENLKKSGIETAEFFPPLFRKLHLRINYRNHRKIVVIDGNVGFVGGFNVGREYLGLDKKFGYWRDTHMKLAGSAVQALQVRFILDWNHAAKENLFLDNSLFQVSPAFLKANCGVQIISSGPDSSGQQIRDNYLRLIHKAKKRVSIQSPYFIPDSAVINAIKIAAMSGIDVRVMIPCKPDHPFVYWATYSYIGDLLEAGVKCYTYDNGFLHAKGLVVDGEVCCYGTANMDIRSYKLNFEVNAVIYNIEIAKEFENIFEKDLEMSSQVTKEIYESRTFVIRVKEQACRLLSPLL